MGDRNLADGAAASTVKLGSSVAAVSSVLAAAGAERADRCTGRRTTAVIRADGTLLDFIDPFDADSGPDDLLKRLVDGAQPLALEPGAHMDGLERVRRRRKKRLRGHDTFHHSGEHT